jgi:sugar phosphate isomerase/epimerase
VSPRLPSFGLSHLGFLDLGAPELVEVAGAAGFDTVAVRVRAAARGGQEHPLLVGSAPSNATRRRLEETGVELGQVELFSLGTEDVALYRPLLEGAAALGARRVLATGDHPDMHLVADRLAALCDLVADLELVVDLEFMPFRPVATLAEAIEVVSLAACDGARVLVDALHLARSGGRVPDVAAAPRRLLGTCHLCDAPEGAPPPAELADEARGDRLPPGEGELPLAALVGALPDDTPFVVEAPLGPRYAELDDADRARLLHRAAAPLLAVRFAG